MGAYWFGLAPSNQTVDTIIGRYNYIIFEWIWIWTGIYTYFGVGKPAFIPFYISTYLNKYMIISSERIEPYIHIHIYK